MNERMTMAAPLEVGICCENLQKLAAFYVEQLGFTRISEIEVPAAKAGLTGLTSGSYRVVRLQSPWGERLKLLQPAIPSAARRREMEILSRTGTMYLTFIVPQLQPVLDRLLALEVELLSGPRRVEVRAGVFLVFARDPEGNLLEFVEYANLAVYRPDLVGGRPA